MFAPSLFLGAMAGGFFGTVAHQIFPESTASPLAYSIVGMGVVVSGTTQGPLIAILIIFEMTGNYKIILPLMISCIASASISGQLVRESVYTYKLSKRGIDIKAGKEVNVLKSILVKDVMNVGVETIPENLNLGQLAEKISESKYNSFPVVDEKNNLVGILSFFDYCEVIFDENLKHLVVARDIATKEVITVSTDDNLFDALEVISKKDFSVLPVVSSNNPSKLMGILTRRDIVSTYDKVIIKRSVFG